MPEGLKKCSKCREVKIYEEFYANKAKHDGLQGYCISCKKKHENTPERRYKAYLRSARKRGYLFILSFEEFLGLWKKPCHYCGQPINGIGIDRVNNKLNYKIDNVVSCCGTCNLMKGQLDQAAFIRQCRLIFQNNQIKTK